MLGLNKLCSLQKNESKDSLYQESLDFKTLI